ncbi:hypothetical protein BJ742DRAFT_828281 [Cladochytrium replicatum]|nr:hypothetical protein BJ742DRAFT_828281 [Cladochytrium replicatum]
MLIDAKHQLHLVIRKNLVSPKTFNSNVFHDQGAKILLTALVSTLLLAILILLSTTLSIHLLPPLLAPRLPRSPQLLLSQTIAAGMASSAAEEGTKFATAFLRATTTIAIGMVFVPTVVYIKYLEVCAWAQAEGEKARLASEKLDAEMENFVGVLLTAL